MPEIKHTFTGGKMNKDLDERLVPNGEYRSATNIQVRTTDGDAAGTVQGIKGNKNVGSFTSIIHPNTNKKHKTVGSVVDEKNDNIYFLTAAPPVDTFSIVNNALNLTSVIVFSDYITEQNVNKDIITPVVIDEHTIVAPFSDVFTLGEFTGDVIELTLSNETVEQKIRTGMKLEVFEGVGNDLLDSAYVKSVYNNGTNWIVQLQTVQQNTLTTVSNTSHLWIKLSGEKVLNFNYNSKITSINIIDNLMLWTDGYSEPKKINIDRCKAGTTAFVGEQYAINGDFSEDITLNTGNDATFGWSTTGGVGLGTETIPSVGVFTNDDGVNILTLAGLQHWNANNDVNNGEVRQFATGLTIGETYTYSFNYVVTSGTLTSDLNNAVDENASLTGSGTYSFSFTALSTQLNIIFYGTNATPAVNGAVYANISNVSLLSTSTTVYSHTKLYIEDPEDVGSGIYIPITDVEHYDYEGDKINPFLKEEHITVIRKAPTDSPKLQLNSTDRGEGQSEVSISDNSFVSTDNSSSTSGIAIGDVRILEYETLASTVFRLNDTLVFEGNYIEYSQTEYTEVPAIDPATGDVYVDADGNATGQMEQVYSVDYEIQLTIQCKFISYLDPATNEETTEATSKIKIEILSFPDEYLDGSITDWFIRLKQKDPLFELKMGRFAYRYKYEDGEHSSFGPFSELAFLPGEFDYESYKGHNLGMKNNVREIVITNFIPFKTRPLDVKSVDILFKPTDDQNYYVVKTISRGVDAEWELFTPTIEDPDNKLSGQLSITSEMIHSILPEEQALRSWDNVPRYALAQEITGSRLLFANYKQGYDIQLPIGLSQEVVSGNITNIKTAHKSIKSLRDYKWGMVFGDKYGRETPVFSSGFTTGYDENYSSITGDISLDQDFASKQNKFKLKQQWSTPHSSTNSPPDWAEYVKYYVKETSNEYYNLVLNKWYWAEDQQTTVWLSFQSTDRNKVDEETYLIAKSVNGEARPIKDFSKYKILAIENEAPDYIKTKHNIIGKIEALPGDENTFQSIWSGAAPNITTDSPDMLVSPDPDVGRAITITLDAWQGIFGTTGTQSQLYEFASIARGKMSFRIVGQDANSVQKFTDWNEIVNHRVKEETVDGSAQNVFTFSYAKDFGDSANMVARFTADINLSYNDGDPITGLKYFMEFKEEKVENLPEFDGRFFVKVEADNSIIENILRISKIEQKWVSVGTFDIDYIESESTTSALEGPYSNESWGWGEGNGWWHNAFDMVDQWTDFSGGDPIAWDENQGTTWSYQNGNITLQSWQNNLYNGARQFSYQSSIFGPDGNGYSPFNYVGGVNMQSNCIVPSSTVGLKDGFAFYCWKAQTSQFWASRKNAYGSRPFIDAAGVAGTKGYSYTSSMYAPSFNISIGAGTSYAQNVDTPPGLDAGVITSALSTAMGLGGATTPTAGHLGRMCLAVCHYGGFDDLTSAHQQFFEKMSDVGTKFRFTADPDNIYVIVSSVDYSDKVANYHAWYSTSQDIEVALASGNSPNHRIGIQVQFRKLNAAGVITNDAINPTVFDPRGHCRHDGTISTPIEILRRVSEGGEAMTFESNASIFETEPKENVDLDVYYEGSDAIPLTLNSSNANNFIPANCGFSIERPNNGSIEYIVLPNDLTDDPINNPTHMVADVITKNRHFNNDFISDDSLDGNGDTILHLVNKSISGGNIVTQNHGIYIGDHICFYHKNGTKTRSKITGFVNKTVSGTNPPVYTPTDPSDTITGVIQANPDESVWTQTTTDGSNPWDPSSGNYINSVSMISGGFENGTPADLEAGMIMTGYVEVDSTTGQEIAGTEGIVPPGVVVVATSDNNVIVQLTSSEEKPFYFKSSDGTPQSHTEFAINNSSMGKRFKVQFTPAPTGYYSIDKEVWKYPVDLGWYNCYAFGNGVESDRIREDFNAPQINNGVKASTTFSGYREESRSNGIIYSGLYNSTSEVNNLNEFNMSQKITKDLNPSYGSIQRLKTRDTDLVVFTEDKILKILSNKDAVFNADGNPQLTATDKVLGTAIPFVGDYGISKNPESLAWDNFRMYFTDKQRGAVLRLSQDGLTPISNVGMKSWFRNSLKYADSILGTFDVVSGEYNVTINKKYSNADISDSNLFPDSVWVDYANGSSDLLATYGNDPEVVASMSSLRDHYILWGQYEDRTFDPIRDLEDIKPITVSFSEESKGWVSFKSFMPDAGGSVSGKYVTAKGSTIYEHYTSSTYNNFYDVQHESKISILFNDMSGSIKSFNAINYEGSQSRIVQNTTDDSEYYNLVAKDGWYVHLFETDKQSGTVPEFIEKEGKWFNKINGTATTLSNLDTGEFTVQGIGNPSDVSSIYS